MKWEICEAISPTGVWRANNGERELVIVGAGEAEAGVMIEALNDFEDVKTEHLSPRHREDKPS